MNIWKSWNYYLKTVFRKKITWITLLIHLICFLLFIFVAIQGGYGKPNIDNSNSFFSCVLPTLIFYPFLIWTYVFSPIAWLFWGWIEDVSQKTQKDGTDLFFLSTEVPTNRKQIFWGKAFFLFSSLIGLYLITFALPLSLLLWRSSYFVNFTAIQTFLFLTWNFLITPLFFFAPLVIFLFSLASLDSVWYNFVKWFSRLSFIFIILIFSLIFQMGELGKKIYELYDKFKDWQKQHYLLTILVIAGVIILLALSTLRLAYKKFQKKDLS